MFAVGAEAEALGLKTIKGENELVLDGLNLLVTDRDDQK